MLTPHKMLITSALAKGLHRFASYDVRSLEFKASHTAAKE